MQLPHPSYQTNRFLRQPLAGDVGLGDTLGAVWEDTRATNPGRSFMDVTALNRARRGTQVTDPYSAGTMAGETFMGAGGENRFTGPETPYLSIEEQERRIEDLGLSGRITPYDGETEEGFAMRVRWKQDEIALQNTLMNSSGGIGTTVLSFAAGLGASLLDPVNIAAGFVPAVGPARYARMLRNAGSRLGRAGVRARVGAAEGAIGSVLVEPLVLAGVSAREADYSIYDSMANVVFGTAIGGGLHVLGGSVRDAFDGGASWRAVDALPAQDRADVLGAGIAAMADGRMPIVMEPLTLERLARSAGTFRGALNATTARVGTYEGAPEIGATRLAGHRDLGADPTGEGFQRRAAERSVELPDGTRLTVPDAPHAELMRYALDMEARPDMDMTERRQALFEMFDGFAEHDPDAGYPFADVADVDDLARDYLEQGRDAGDDAGSIVSPDAGDSFARLLAAQDAADVFRATDRPKDAPASGGTEGGSASPDAPQATAGPVSPRIPLADVARKALEPQNRIFAAAEARAKAQADETAARAPANDDLAGLQKAVDAEVDALVAQYGGERREPGRSGVAERVASDLRRQLAEAGMTDEQAVANAQVHGSFANVLSKEYGADPTGIYERLDVTRGRTGTDGTGFDQETQVQRDTRKFKADVERFERGEFDRQRMLLVGQTPDILQLAGMPEKPLQIPQGVVRKIGATKARGKHQIDRDTLLRLPELLADPLAVLHSRTRPDDSLVAVLDATDADGAPVIATIRDQGDSFHINTVSSMYGKNRSTLIRMFSDPNGIIYADMERAGAAFRQQGVQFPKQEVLTGSSPDMLTKDDLVNTVRFNQGRNANARGRITFGEDRTLIQLFEGADASTFLHESGHFFIETMQAIADAGGAPARLTDDLNTLKRFTGLGEGERFTRDAHETIARAFEAYMREGRAPDDALAQVFRRIRDWLVDVYRSIRDLDVELTDEVRGVFDRMLATDEQMGRDMPADLRREMDAADFSIGLAQSRARAMTRAAQCVLGAV